MYVMATFMFHNIQIMSFIGVFHVIDTGSIAHVVAGIGSE